MERSTGASLRFEDTFVDLAARELWRAGRAVHLEPQAFDLLEFLIAERSRVVPKHEILERVWGDQFVSEAALTTRIKEIRRAVGDDGRTQRVIRNVRGRGYRFVAGVSHHDETRDGADDDAPGAAADVPGLVGRRRDVDTTVEALADSRIVTIVGPGGVGKSTLARAVADVVSPPDGVVELRLAALRPADVVPALRRAAGIHSREIDDDEAVRAIAALDTLVVLDNCEHLIAEVAGLAGQLVDSGRVRVVATSRERLGHPSERVIPLAPLEAHDARELFRSRVGAAGRTQPPTADDELGVIDRITDAVDRLPLAIEMAAGLAASLSLEELADLLERRLDVLRSPNRASEDRQRTIASLVDWSTAPLPDAPRDLLRGLTVFGGPARATDVIGVLAGGDAGAFADLSELVDRSLVVAAAEPAPTRYRLLATIRSAVGSPDVATRRSHAAWFAAAAEQADLDLGRGGSGWEIAASERLDDMIAETRAATRWALAEAPSLAVRLVGSLERYAHTRLWPEPPSWATLLLADERLEPRERAIAATAVASAATHRGDYVGATELAEAAIDELRGDAASPFDPVASALETLSDVHLYAGELERAAEYARALRRRGRERGDGYWLATGVVGEMLAASYDARQDDALALVETIDVDSLPPSGRAWIAYGTAEALAANDLVAAIEHYEQALGLAESASNHFVRVIAATSLLSARSRLDDPHTALASFDGILREFRRAGCRSAAATAMRNLVDVFSRVGLDEPAMVLVGVVDASPKQTFGAERELLENARNVAMRRCGADMVSAWVAHGAAAARDERGIDVALEQLSVAIAGGAHS